MATILDTFVTEFRFKTDKAGLQQAEKGLSNFKGELIKIGATLGGIFAAKSFFSGITDRLDELGKFAASVGVSVGELDALQFAAQRAGVPINSLKGSLTSLNKIIGATARGSASYNTMLSMYGVSIRKSDSSLKNSAELLKSINLAFQQLSAPQQADFAQNLGIDSSTMRLLQQTPKEYDALIKKAQELGVVTEQQTKTAARFNDELLDLKHIFFDVSANVSTLILPTLIKLGEGLESIIKHIKDLYDTSIAFHGLVDVLKDVGIAFASLASAAIVFKVFSSITAAIISFVAFVKNSVTALSVLFTETLPEIFAVALSIPGLGQAIAGFTALFLLVQDFYTYLEGGKSVVGAVSAAFTTWYKDLLGYISHLEKGVEGFFNFFEDEARKIKDFFAHPIKTLEGNTGNKTADKNSLPPSQPMPSLMQDLTRTFTMQPMPIMAANTSNTSSITDSRTQTVDVGGITINATNTDVKGINDRIVGELSQRLKTTAFNYDSTIKR